MEKIKKELKLITKIIADDGQVFDIDYKNLEKKYIEKVENHNKEYHETYEFKNFVIDDDKLLKWNNENWEHFKWYIFRNMLYDVEYLRRSWETRIIKRQLPIVLMNSIDTPTKLQELINTAIENSYENSHEKSNGYKIYSENIFEDDILFSSGLLIGSDKVISSIIYKKDLKRLKHAYRNLKINITKKHVANVMGMVAFEDKYDNIINIKNPYKEDKPSKYYYSMDSNIMKIIKYVIKNCDCDLDGYVIDLLNKYNNNTTIVYLHILYTITKELGKKLILHKTEFYDLMAYYLYFFDQDIQYKIKSRKYFDTTGYFAETNIHDFINKEVIETYFLNFSPPYTFTFKQNHFDYYISSGIERSKIYYHLYMYNVKYDLDEEYEAEFNEILKIYDNKNKSFMNLEVKDVDFIIKLKKGLYLYTSSADTKIDEIKKRNNNLEYYKNRSYLSIIDIQELDVFRESGAKTKYYVSFYNHKPIIFDTNRTYSDIQQNYEKIFKEYGNVEHINELENLKKYLLFFNETELTYERFLKDIVDVDFSSYKNKLKKELLEIEKQKEEILRKELIIKNKLDE